MIEMIKKSSISFHIRVDMQGVEQILNYIENTYIDVKVDLELIYLEKSRKFEIELDNQKDELIINENVIKMCMDDEEIDYLKQRLEEAQIRKSFYPSEICDRHYKNKNVTLYCDVI